MFALQMSGAVKADTGTERPLGKFLRVSARVSLYSRYTHKNWPIWCQQIQGDKLSNVDVRHQMSISVIISN